MTQKRKNPIKFEQINQKMTTNLHTIINNVNHFTNYLNSGKTWKNIKDIYILTYTCADQSCIDNLIRWCFFFQNSEQITGDKIILTFAQNVNKLLE